MICKRIIKTTIFLIFSAALFCQDQLIIKSLTIKGLNLIPLQRTMELIPLSPGASISQDKLLQLMEPLYDEYASHGYHYTSLDSSEFNKTADSLKVDVTLWFTQGKQAIIKGITSNYKNLPIFNIVGDVFTPKNLQKKMSHILEYFNNNGRPHTLIEVSELVFKEKKTVYEVYIKLFIHTGSKAIINKIIFNDSLTVNPAVLIRETRLKTGDIFSGDKISKAVNYLKELEYIKKIEKPVIEFKKDSANIHFNLIENNANTFDGIVGYIPAENDRQKGYFTGRIKFNFLNLLGTGRRLKIFWQKKNQLSQDMQLEYTEPWIFGLPADIEGAFIQEMRDSSYIKRKFEINIHYKPILRLLCSLKAGQINILPDSLESIRKLIPTSKEIFAALNINYRSLDNIINPRNGLNLNISYQIGANKLTGNSILFKNGLLPKKTTGKIVVKLTLVRQIYKNHIAFFHVEGHEAKSSDNYIPISSHIRFGGAQTLRGYNEDAFSGSIAAWFNLEYRYLFTPLSRIFIFVDGGGWDYRNPDKKHVSGIKYGYGFGLRIETRLGVIGIDYGLGQGDRFTNAKIHVGIINTF